jgi:hypothetical protein
MLGIGQDDDDEDDGSDIGKQNDVKFLIMSVPCANKKPVLS